MRTTTCQLWALFLILMVCLKSAGQVSSFAANKIPDALLKDADAVMRNYHIDIDVVSTSEINVVERYTVTVLNKDGYYFALLNRSCNSFHDVINVTGTLYDKNGNEIRDLKKHDITVTSPYRDETLFDDLKVKHFDFNYSDYPFTVSFEIHTTYNESFWLPGFSPQNDMRCAIEKADFEFTHPKSIPVRFKPFHLADKPVTTEVAGIKKITGHVTNVSAEKDREMDHEDEFFNPRVIFAANDFEYAGIKGKMDTWKSFGKFLYNLNANRNDLPADMKKTVHKLTDTCENSFSKINVLYNYLQKNTRYIAIETGVSGLQCIDAPTVCADGYSDCKGLSNFMSAMLKEAGIPSYGVLIYGGNDSHLKMQPDFPYNTFNHYILCVPQQPDTIWLECTSKNAPPGYLSSFTGNRNALLLTPDGGFMVKTPVYTSKENTASRIVNIRINASGVMDADLKLIYTGSVCDAERGHVTDVSKEKAEEHFIEKFALSGYRIKDYTIDQYTVGYAPAIREELSITGPAKINRTGKRLFLSPLMLPLSVTVPSSTETRTTPFHISHSYQVSDTEIIRFEDAYVAEHLPAEINTSHSFGSYTCKFYFEEGTLLKIVRHFQQTHGTYTPDLFPEYLAFTKSVNSTLNQVVLIKKE